MKNVEVESFLKSFSIFFISIGALISAIYYINYTKDIQKLDDDIFSKMKICSYDLQCEEYDIDFVLTQEKELYKLHKTKDAVLSYFPISLSAKNSLSISLDLKKYNASVKETQEQTIISLSAVMVVVLALSGLFALYSMYPLRNALLLTEEFVKDILHDFNTPLSTLRLNTSMLEKEFGSNQKISRIQKSVQTILDLQMNLRSYLNNIASQKENIDLKELVNERVAVAQTSYETIKYVSRVEEKNIFTNREAFTRVLDNLLSNAGKYNKANGTVEISLSENAKVLFIKDSGKGIQKPQKIFDRFYKEQDRGIGIGLHIVKKLCTELGIKVSVESELGKGSTFYLELE